MYMKSVAMGPHKPNLDTHLSETTQLSIEATQFAPSESDPFISSKPVRTIIWLFSSQNLKRKTLIELLYHELLRDKQVPRNCSMMESCLRCLQFFFGDSPSVMVVLDWN